MLAGVEFAGELMDWIQTDLKKVDADRVKDMRYSTAACCMLQSCWEGRSAGCMPLSASYCETSCGGGMLRGNDQYAQAALLKQQHARWLVPLSSLLVPTTMECRLHAGLCDDSGLLQSDHRGGKRGPGHLRHQDAILCGRPPSKAGHQRHTGESLLASPHPLQLRH